MNKSLRSGLALAVVSTLLALSGVDLVLQGWRFLYWRSEYGKTVPFYRWSLVTSNGQELSDRRGPLRLVLDPYAGYRNEAEQHTGNFNINGRGTRGREIRPKEAGRVRILIVGGSTAFATGASDDASTWAAVMERQLPNSEIINGAVIGYVSGQELALLVSDLIDLEPDVVIALNGWNDFSQVSPMPAQYRGRGGETFQQIEDELQRLHGLTTLNPVTRIVRNLEQIFIPVIGETSRFLFRGGHGSRVGVSASLEAYIQNMLKMSSIVQARRVCFAAFIQPFRNSIEAARGRGLSDDQVTGYDFFRRAARRALEKHGVICIDLSEGEQFDHSMFVDAVHLNFAGNDRLAQVVVPHIARLTCSSRAAEQSPDSGR